ncbi:MAG: 8-amino-7-oxononanoate synthase [Deltaproteobacteria bacterium RBG_13_61_14]|nr:MAG: 8-amino-7-oxononanoate synthase [Deltaproteobacteria bacterium RBG_13_61_14]
MTDRLDWIQQELAELDRQDLRRFLRTLESPQGAEIILTGRRVLNFCSNDYLGLAGDPAVIAAAKAASEKWGAGAGASRLIAGNLGLFAELESALARLKGYSAALLLGSGYQANLGLIPALADRGDVIFSDRLNHASLIDGCRLARAETKIFEHLDLNQLEAQLRQAQKFRRRLIVVESLYSMDGDIFPLLDLVALAKKYDAMTYVDEAHATGTLGAAGRGGLEHFGMGPEVDVLMGTLSKALGSFGAFVCASRELIAYFINRARSFIFATGLPPAAAGAALQAVRILEQEPSRRQALLANVRALRQGFERQGFPLPQHQVPIFPFIIGDAKKTLETADRLLEIGLFVQAIRPPTVPAGTSRLRITVRADHSQPQLDALLSALHKADRV